MIFMEHAKTQKFYWLTIEQDLLGAWYVKKVYGILPDKITGSELLMCANEHDASLLLCDLEIAKRKQGYVYSSNKF